MDRSQQYVVYLGASQIDEYYRTERFPEKGSKCLVSPMKPMLGGMLANAASMLAAYGHKTYLLDTLNYSELSDYMINELQSYGLDLSYLYRNADIGDSKTIIILAEGERTIFVVESDRPSYAMDERHFDLLSNAAYLYSGLNDYGKIEDTDRVLAAIKAAGTKIALDADSHAARGKNDWIFPLTDLLFVNEFGFLSYRGDMTEDECFEYLFSLGIETVVVTKGAEGCEARTRSERVTVPGIKVDVVDATGAGDTFNSSFLYATLHGYTLLQAARFANAAAARAVTKMGPRGGACTEPEVLALMKQYYGE